MSFALIALMVAVAFEAAVIVALVLRLRRLGSQDASPTRFHWDEPMPWMQDEQLKAKRTHGNG